MKRNNLRSMLYWTTFVIGTVSAWAFVFVVPYAGLAAIKFAVTGQQWYARSAPDDLYDKAAMLAQIVCLVVAGLVIKWSQKKFPRPN